MQFWKPLLVRSLVPMPSTLRCHYCDSGAEGRRQGGHLDDKGNGGKSLSARAYLTLSYQDGERWPHLPSGRKSKSRLSSATSRLPDHQESTSHSLSTASYQVHPRTWRTWTISASRNLEACKQDEDENQRVSGGGRVAVGSRRNRRRYMRYLSDQI